jgi:8-oxo-dGTP pyrophosphatase MutT (NUDIX family)
MSPRETVMAALRRLKEEHGIVVTRLDAVWLDVSTLSKRDHTLQGVEIVAHLAEPSEKTA